MAPAGIDPRDWDRVHGIAVACANSMADEVLERNRRRMRELLARLRSKYGDHPSLLATEGDYASSPQEAVDLYKRALDLSLDTRNTREAVLIALSLADKYAGDLRDAAGARQWLQRAMDLSGGDLSGYAEEVRWVHHALQENASGASSTSEDNLLE